LYKCISIYAFACKLSLFWLCNTEFNIIIRIINIKYFTWFLLCCIFPYTSNSWKWILIIVRIQKRSKYRYTYYQSPHTVQSPHITKPSHKQFHTLWKSNRYSPTHYKPSLNKYSTRYTITETVTKKSSSLSKWSQ
jgi:hypothetical protein